MFFKIGVLENIVIFTGKHIIIIISSFKVDKHTKRKKKLVKK